MPGITPLCRTFGVHARDRRIDALQPGVEGARSALESFYHAFNNRSLAVFDTIWRDDPCIQLNNPLGGIDRGLQPIRELYRKIFEGPAVVTVELHDIVEMIGSDLAIFAGRERARSTRDGVHMDFEIRTTRVFGFTDPVAGWRQMHHHGSIADADVLRRYQMDVLPGAAEIR